MTKNSDKRCHLCHRPIKAGDRWADAFIAFGITAHEQCVDFALLCTSCGINHADLPSSLCADCDAGAELQHDDGRMLRKM